MGILGKLPGWDSASRATRYTARMIYGIIFFFIFLFILNLAVLVSSPSDMQNMAIEYNDIPSYNVFYIEYAGANHFWVYVEAPLNTTEDQLVSISKKIVEDIKNQYQKDKIWATIMFWENKKDHYELKLPTFAGVCYFDKDAYSVVPADCIEEGYNVYHYGPKTYRELKEYFLKRQKTNF